MNRDYRIKEELRISEQDRQRLSLFRPSRLSSYSRLRYSLFVGVNRDANLRFPPPPPLQSVLRLASGVNAAYSHKIRRIPIIFAAGGSDSSNHLRAKIIGILRILLGIDAGGQQKPKRHRPHDV